MTTADASPRAEAAASSYPVRRRFQTDDPDRAHEFIRTVYVEHAPRIRGSGAEFCFQANVAGGGGFSIGRLDYSMTLEAVVEPSEFVTVHQVLGGVFRYSAGSEDYTLSRGDLFLAPPGRSHLTHTEDIRLGAVRLDIGAIKEIAAAMTGIAPAALLFDAGRPLTPALGRYWQDTVHHIAKGVFGNETAMANPIIRAQALSSLAVAALCCFPNNSADGEGGNGHATPAAVRRAVDFIETNFERTVSLADIAEVARVGPRSLQMAFRRHLNTTPTAYIRLLRLERVHRDLQRADPTRGDTVAAIATRWGFAHHGRFAQSYQRTYGCSPRETLHG